MIKQGFTISANPDAYQDGVYNLFVYSTAWDDEFPFDQQQAIQFSVSALPHECLAEEFSGWLGSMMIILARALSRQLTIVDIDHVSAATLARKRRPGDTPQKM